MTPYSVIPFPSPPKERDRTQPRIVHGRIKGMDQDAFIVRLENGRITPAYKSSGCLLAPEVGDVVLLYVGPGKAAYVLTVLEKATPVATLEFDDAVYIKAGRVEIEGTESLHLSIPEADVRVVRRPGFFSTCTLAGYARGAVRTLIREMRGVLRKAGSSNAARPALPKTGADKPETQEAEDCSRTDALGARRLKRRQ
ncbi:MAG: hypothetical protein PWQ57_630 [Desulfovibrionales bacterium]|jgi:hypothetical protein|nr:hypothetical protein [Desulfovibrionales bacterium]